MGNKYLEYKNNKLIELDAKNNVKKNNIVLNFIHHYFTNALYEAKLKVWKLFRDDMWYNIHFIEAKSSGIPKNNNKRVQISSSSKLLLNNKIIIYYDAGNEFCFISSDTNNIYKHDCIKQKSIWLDFNCIYECLKNGKNIYKEISSRKHKFTLFFSKNLLDVLNIDKNNFSSNANKINCSDSIGFLKPFKIKKNININVNKDKLIDDRYIGQIAEQIFNYFLTYNNDKISELLDLKIYKHKWLNEKEESYMPYDFLINDNIYVDVKGTWQNKPYFNITDNEIQFRTNLKNSKYFIFNIYNINENMEFKFKVFNSNELSSMNFDIKSTYTYKEENNE